MSSQKTADKTVAERWATNSVLVLIPTYHPYHKPAGPFRSFDQRLHSLEEKTKELQTASVEIRVSDIEKTNPGIQGKTIRLLEALPAIQQAHKTWIAIGMDAWYNLPKWHKIKQWYTKVNWIVLRRPTALQATPAPSKRLQIPTELSACTSAYKRTVHNDYVELQSTDHSIVFADNPLLDISSTAINKNLLQHHKSGTAIQ